MEKLFRSRVARAALAAAVIAAGVWGFAPYILKDVATSAYVNAELTRVTTPVAGVLTDGLPQEGAYLARDARMQLVTARTPNRARLDDLEQQATLAASTVELMEAQLAEIGQDDRDLKSRSALFKSASAGRLDGRVRQAEAEAAACDARRSELQDKYDRAAKLAAQGFISEAGLRSARDAAEAGAQTCKAARANLEALRAESAAARYGVYLGEGGNDAPYTDQQRARLMLRRQELMTELVKARASQAQLKAQTAAERQTFARTASYEAVLPAEHLIWTVEARPGSEVVEGQTLMTVADCRNRFVVVELPARKIEHLSVGDTARVRLLGSDRWQDGRVRRITGGAARQDMRLFAAEMPRPGKRSFTVEVSLPSSALTDQRRSCDIGRPADVRFGGSRLNGSDSRLAAADEDGRL
jgi:multidrug resistance efflux pump